MRFNFLKILGAVLLVCGLAVAQPVNPDFSAGSLAGWTVIDGSVYGDIINPGVNSVGLDFYAVLRSPDSAFQNFGRPIADDPVNGIAGIESSLGLTGGTLASAVSTTNINDPGGNPIGTTSLTPPVNPPQIGANPDRPGPLTNPPDAFDFDGIYGGSAITQTFNANAGATIDFTYAFNTDSLPGGQDRAFVSLVNNDTGTQQIFVLDEENLGGTGLPTVAGPQLNFVGVGTQSYTLGFGIISTGISNAQLANFDLDNIAFMNGPAPPGAVPEVDANASALPLAALGMILLALGDGRRRRATSDV